MHPLGSGWERAGACSGIVAIVGPTAAGKTDFSVQLARALDAEIISADSRQVYRGFDIGTAKPTIADRGGVPHHGFDEVDPADSYSAGAFARDARRWIGEIRSRGRLPLVVGGTGFFVQALVRPLFPEPPLDRGRVAELRNILLGMDRERLEAWVRALDPPRAGIAIQGGSQRMVRTLVVALLTGRPLSWWHASAAPTEESLEARIVSLELPVEELDSRIEARARAMIQEGLVEEARRHLAAGVQPTDPAMSAVGYREVIRHLRGESELDACVSEIVAATRRYARRQRTWFRNQLPDHGVLRVDASGSGDQIVAETLSWLEATSPSGEGQSKQGGDA